MKLSELTAPTEPPKTLRLSDAQGSSASAQTQQPAQAPLNLSQPITAEQIAGNPVTRFAVGAAAPILGAFQLGANVGDWLAEQMGFDPVVGKKMNELMAEYDAMKRRGMAADQGVPEGEEGFDWAGLGGAVAGPTAGLMKAGTSVFGIGGNAVTRADKIGEGLRIGGVFGATTPVTSGADSTLPEHGVNTAAGAAIGGAIPAVTGVVKGAGALIRDTSDLITSGGPRRIAGRYLDRILPDERGPLITALETAKAPVPGYPLTAAEATSALPEGTVIRAQQDITARSGRNVSPAFSKRLQEQNKALIDAIDTIAGSEAKLTAAETSRQINANKNYGDAFKQVIRADSELGELVRNPFFKKAWNDAQDILTSRKVTPKQNLTETLHIVKRSLDKMLSKANEKPLGPEEQKEVMAVKDSLVSWLARMNVSYETARRQFAQDSAPINRMQVGQVLKEKLVPAITTEGEGEAALRTASYAQGLRDAPRTIKSASTQMPRFEKLSDVLTPDEVATAEAIAKTLAMRLQPAQKTSLPGGVDVVKETVGTLPSILSRPVVLAKDLIRRRAGRGQIGIEEAVDEVMGQYFLNPKQFAEAIKGLTPGPLGTALRRYASIVRNPAIIGLTDVAATTQNPQQPAQ